jgi:hypothetical protein
LSLSQIIMKLFMWSNIIEKNRYEFSSASSKYGSTFICWHHYMTRIGLWLASRQCLLHIKIMLKLQCKTTFWSNQRLCNRYLLLPQAALKRKTKDWLPRNQKQIIMKLFMWSKLMKYYLKKIDTSFHQRLPNMIQRLFADIITWRELVYEYSWEKSPMISGHGSDDDVDHINNFIIICHRIKINCHHMFIRNPMMCVKDRNYI